jgi:hypothetical protein
MTDLRDAARQALEALKSVQDHKPNYETNAAITALRAALEQHEKDVEWMKQRHANWRLQKELAEQTQERDRQQREYEESRSAALEQPEPDIYSLPTNKKEPRPGLVNLEEFPGFIYESPNGWHIGDMKVVKWLLDNREADYWAQFKEKS